MTTDTVNLCLSEPHSIEPYQTLQPETSQIVKRQPGRKTLSKLKRHLLELCESTLDRKDLFNGHLPESVAVAVLLHCR
jgi:hypothetical protein